LSRGIRKSARAFPSADLPGSLAPLQSFCDYRPLVFRLRKDQVQTFTRRMHHMARKPNYDFERRERERLKNLKNAARAEAKLKAPADEVPVVVPDETSTPE